MGFARAQGNTFGQGGGAANWTISKAGTTVGTGNLIVGFVTWGTSTTTDLTAVQLGTTNCTIINRIGDATNSQGFASFYLLNAPAGQTTVTATGLQGGGALGILWEEFSGVDASCAFDGGNKAFQSAAAIGANSVLTGAAFGNAGDLIWGGAVNDHTASTISAGTSPNVFNVGTNDNADASFFGLSLYSEWLTTTGASDVTFGTTAITSIYSVGMSFTAPNPIPIGWTIV